jgi:hypothetical protein
MSRTLSGIESDGIIKRRIIDIWGGYYYSLNTDISKWNSHSINLTKLSEIVGITDFATVTENATVTETETITKDATIIQKDNSYPKINATVTENAMQQLPKTQQCTLYKEILKKDIKKGQPIPEFENITMTDEDYQKLISEFGETTTFNKIKALSMYKRSKGKKYKDDYATIMNWDRMDINKQGKLIDNNPDKFIQGKYGHEAQR